MLRADKDVEQVNFHVLLMGRQNGVVTLKNNCSVSLKVKYTVIM